MTSKKIRTVVFHVLVAFGGLIMIYPMLWMVFSSFDASGHSQLP